MTWQSEAMESVFSPSITCLRPQGRRPFQTEWARLLVSSDYRESSNRLWNKHMCATLIFDDFCLFAQVLNVAEPDACETVSSSLTIPTSKPSVTILQKTTKPSLRWLTGIVDYSSKSTKPRSHRVVSISPLTLKCYNSRLLEQNNWPILILERLCAYILWKG